MALCPQRQQIVVTSGRISDLVRRPQEVTMGKESLNHLACVDCKQVRHDKTTQNRQQHSLVYTVQ